jgi:hypothetical protein
MERVSASIFHSLFNKMYYDESPILGPNLFVYQIIFGSILALWVGLLAIHALAIWKA